MIIEIALITIEKYKSLLARQVEIFTSRFKIRVDKLSAIQDKLTAGLEVLTLTLLGPLV